MGNSIRNLNNAPGIPDGRPINTAQQILESGNIIVTKVVDNVTHPIILTAQQIAEAGTQAGNNVRDFIDGVLNIPKSVNDSIRNVGNSVSQGVNNVSKGVDSSIRNISNAGSNVLQESTNYIPLALGGGGLIILLLMLSKK
jgi:predicted RecA/RadA family phage recombinase